MAAFGELRSNVLCIHLKDVSEIQLQEGKSKGLGSKRSSASRAAEHFCFMGIGSFENQRLLINVDESSHGRSVKRNYEWLPIGV